MQALSDADRKRNLTLDFGNLVRKFRAGWLLIPHARQIHVGNPLRHFNGYGTVQYRMCLDRNGKVASGFACDSGEAFQGKLLLRFSEGEVLSKIAAVQVARMREGVQLTSCEVLLKNRLNLPPVLIGSPLTGD